MDRKMPRLIKGTNGFSLIELLTVIAIIAILSAILIPVTNLVRNSARTTKSLSNLRQLASAMQMYSSDNKGLYPVGYHSPNSGHEVYWYLEIEPYINQKTVSGSELSNILVSPFINKDLREGYYADGDVRSSPSTYSVHGVICPSLRTNYTEDPRFPLWSIKENHSEIILVAEGTLMSSGYAKAVLDSEPEWYTLGNSSTPALDNKFPIANESTSGALSYRANNHALVAFLDGHVEALEKGEVTYRNVVIER